MSYMTEHVFVSGESAFLFPLYIHGLERYDTGIIDLK